MSNQELEKNEEKNNSINKNMGLEIKKLENQWQQSLPRFSEKELLEIFPGIKHIIPEKIKELEKEKAKLLDGIKKQLTFIKHKVSDEFSRWFCRCWLKINEGAQLSEIEWQIARFERLLFISKGGKAKGEITQEKIQQALAVPIENLISQPLRKSGRNLVGLCPLHQEKTPSFFIYPESNSFYCYGCNQGGNVINFLRLLYGYSFREAIKHLTGDN